MDQEHVWNTGVREIEAQVGREATGGSEPLWGPGAPHGGNSMKRLGSTAIGGNQGCTRADECLMEQ